MGIITYHYWPKRGPRKKRKQPPIASAMVALCCTAGPVLAQQPTHTAGRKWWVLNGSESRCQPAEELVPNAPTPEAWRLAILRNERLFATPHVKHLDDGQLYGVLFQFKVDGQDLSMAWFAQKQYCDDALRLGIADGYLPDPADMK